MRVGGAAPVQHRHYASSPRLARPAPLRWKKFREDLFYQLNVVPLVSTATTQAPRGHPETARERGRPHSRAGQAAVPTAPISAGTCCATARLAGQRPRGPRAQAPGCRSSVPGVQISARRQRAVMVPRRRPAAKRGGVPGVSFADQPLAATRATRSRRPARKPAGEASPATPASRWRKRLAWSARTCTASRRDPAGSR